MSLETNSTSIGLRVDSGGGGPVPEAPTYPVVKYFAFGWNPTSAIQSTYITFTGTLS